MKLQLYSSNKSSHASFASCVCWATNDLVLTCGDDRRILFWSSASYQEPVKNVQLPIDAYPTAMHFLASSSNSTTALESGSSFSNFKLDHQSNQMIALGASNGTFYLLPFNWNGHRMEKSFEAHTGAIIVIRWSNDSSTLATGGEDGLIKIWSRSGMLRSTINASSLSVYALSWSPDSNSLVYSNGNHLLVKSLSPQSRSQEWLAHDGLVLSLHWSPLNGFILSASEDARVKMWDINGRLLFVSAQTATVPSCVSWSPDGNMFAICTFDSLKLHDSSGTCLSVEKLSSEGIQLLAWSPDSNQLSSVCASGQVIFSYVIERVLEVGVWQTMTTSRRAIKVTNCTTDLTEVLEFRDSITRMSFAYDHLVVLTTSQCFIYQSSNWTTPHHFDANNMEIIMIKQSRTLFLLMSSTTGSLYSYDGRFVRSVKLINQRLDSLSPNLLSINTSTLAYRDGVNQQTVHFVDLENSSKSASHKERHGNSYRHALEVTILKMSSESIQEEQICAFLDKNSDLYIISFSDRRGNLQAFKLTSMIVDFIWHSEANVLASLAENHSLTLWLFPNVAFVDSSLLQDVILTVTSGELATKSCRIVDFVQNQLTVQRVDNVKVYIPVNPFVVLLHRLKAENRWQEAVKMCNFLDKSVQEVQSIDRNVCNSLWATLAAMALDAKEFEVAEIAYAAINKLHKVLFLSKIKALPVQEAVSAELELMWGNIDGAEQYFLQKGFILRAILLNLELFRWKRALQLAKKYNAEFAGITIENGLGVKARGESIAESDVPQDNNLTLIHLVLACRHNYLKTKDKQEKLKEFEALFNQVDQLIEWTNVEKMVKNNDNLIYTKTL